MSILEVGVAVANKATKALRFQTTVSYQRWTGQNAFGEATYAAAVDLLAIVDWQQKQVRTRTGILTVSRASVTFLDIVALVAATGGLGIDDNDILILPSGDTGPILDMSGFIDADSAPMPVATTVWLG